jgi:TPR repeat protein
MVGMNEFMKKIIVLAALLLAAMAQADESDYIWNQQFEKKFALAQQGDVKAQYDVGNMYLKGQGTTRDAKEAFNWFSKAAEQGYSRAEYKLGYLYQRGTGVTKNQDKAYTWLKKSAQKGYTPAMFYLGKLYVGRGDYDTALTWYKRAKAKGYHPAKAEIPKVEAQIAKAKARRTPAPVTHKPVAPKRVVAKKASTPAPAKSASKADRKALYTRALVSSGNWRLAGKPTVLLPSDISVCQTRGDKIICQSDEQEVEEKYGVVSYKMNAEIMDFNNEGEFNVEYQKNVTLIFPSDPDNPNLVIPINYGLQKKELMRCKVMKGDVTCYRGAKREKVVFTRS